MNDSIIASIDAEIQRLENAKALLLTTTGDRFLKHRTATAKKATKKRVLSAAARKRIADAQKRRWAKAKKGTKA